MSEICYKKNYLKEVVARLDFAQPVEALKNPVLPRNVQQALKYRYPIYEPNKALTQGVTFTNEGIKTDQIEFHQWVYHGENREKTITISQHYITVSLKVSSSVLYFPLFVNFSNCGN